jgi:hypothetical protein
MFSISLVSVARFSSRLSCELAVQFWDNYYLHISATSSVSGDNSALLIGLSRGLNE